MEAEISMGEAMARVFKLSKLNNQEKQDSSRDQGKTKFTRNRPDC